jgi:1,4-alpha-glucan branching enzyme
VLSPPGSVLHAPPLQNQLIITDPAVKLGRPVVAGTRLTVDEVLDRLADGVPLEQLVRDHPGLAPEAVREALRYAAEAVRQDSPLAARPARELHGAHPVVLPDGSGGPKPAIAVRAYLPEAEAAAVRRLPDPPGGRAWIPALDTGAAPAPGPTLHPMEKIHPGGVFEAVFPGETEPFPYQLAVTSAGGTAELADSPYGLPASLAPADLPAPPAGSGPAAAPGREPPACRWHEKLGAHPAVHAGRPGVAFAVWAPHCAAVSVVGDFNRWDGLCHPLRPVGETGVWELFVPGLAAGALYKYRLTSGVDGRTCDKADPYAFAAELRPRTASVVWDLGRYSWGDADWIAARPRRQALDQPIAIYEVHLGSWRRAPGEACARRWLTYRELADQLVPYVRDLGYTHIEPMPVAEHPFDGSWGYQVTGFFAPTSRYGTPDDFRAFVDRAHQAGLGVILDWVPGHFPKDAHGLGRFDGTCLYEPADPRRSENLEWGTSSFDLGRPEVAAFLLSSALCWIEQYHVDGLRVDAVSSMIYLDYSRQHWVPNELGGRENLEATAFLQRLNQVVHREHPGVLMIAEESSAWPRVTGTAAPESLGFDLKWNLGWMHDTLRYARQDPIFRRHHHRDLTFSLVYAFNEAFLLPFSHDEVVHGKRSLLSKLPGDPWQQLATLRAIYGYLTAHPGKKLQFMGAELGQRREWNHDAELEWELLQDPGHAPLPGYVRALNRLYAGQPALHRRDFDWSGFQWIDCEDAERSLIAFLRRGDEGDPPVAFAANFTPVPREGYRLGVPGPGRYEELLNSDDAAFGGSGVVNPGPRDAEPLAVGGQPYSLPITLPPLGVVFFGPRPGKARRPARS